MKKSNILLLWILAVSGLSFWFTLGFPFAHQYESYYWMGHYYSTDLLHFIFQPIGHYVSYRPLGQLFSTLLFQLSGETLILIQLFNFILTIFSVMIVILSIDEKEIFSILFFFIGAFLFISFGYIFHLNGLYYAPLLFFISILIFYYSRPFSTKNLYLTFGGAIVASLFNPFAIFIYIFFLVGTLWERKNQLQQKQRRIIYTIIITEIILSFILVPEQMFYLNMDSIRGLLHIYKSIEINILVSIFLLGLVIVTILSIPVKILTKIYFIVFFSLLSVVFYYYNIPILLALVICCSIKLVLLNKTTILFLLAVTLLFTIFTGTKPEHLKFLVLLIITISIAVGTKNQTPEILYRPTLLVSVILVTILSTILLKSNIKVPVISKYTNPLLSRKEKSYQLQNVIKWYLSSTYDSYPIELIDNESIDGQNPPASNEDLQKYLKSVRRNNSLIRHRGKLLVCYDKYKDENHKLLYSIRGKYNEDENVYLYFYKKYNPKE